MRIFLLLFVVGLSSGIDAANFVVHTDEVAPSQTLTNPGDVGLIEEGGTINTGAGNGVTMNASNQILLNKGLINIAGGAGDGVVSSGANNSITNLGSISTVGASTAGITSTGANTTITNHGSIIAQSGGITVTGGNTTVINNGVLGTFGGGGARGIQASGLNNLLINNGYIFTRLSSDLIFSTGANATVINNGQLSAFGAATTGIRITGDNSLLINTGLVNMDPANSDAIIFVAQDSEFINSGTIRARDGFALFNPASGFTLTLLRGSNIQGPVFINQFFRINVETGLNLALAVQSAQSFASFGIDAPFVRIGNFIAVIDPTGLGLQADVLADLSDTILGGVYRHRAGFPCCKNTCERGLWVEGLGSYRDRNRNHDNVGYHNWQGGFIVGYDMPAWCGDIDFFGGATFGKAIVDQRTQQADLSNYFGGASYERILCNNFFGAALVAGYSRLTNDRYVMYNLAPNGIQTAHSTPDGFFVAPELTYARQFSCRWFSPTLSGTVRYAGLFLGSYNEHGSIADLSVHHRKVQLVTTRAELGLPFGKSACDRCWNAEPYLGVAGRFQVSGKNVDATLLGQDIRFNAGNNQNLCYLLVGFRGKQSLGCLSLFFNVEADFDNHHSSRVLGEGGVGVSF